MACRFALREAQLTKLRHPDQLDKLADRGPNFAKQLKLAESTSPEAAKTSEPRLWAAFILSGAGQ